MRCFDICDCIFCSALLQAIFALVNCTYLICSLFFFSILPRSFLFFFLLSCCGLDSRIALKGKFLFYPGLMSVRRLNYKLQGRLALQFGSPLSLPKDDLT